MSDEPCGECDECNAGIRCRELPEKEEPMSMKTWLVAYKHRTQKDQIRRYTVVAEDDDIAGQVGYESLEADECNYDPDPSHWTVISCLLVESCSGCGGFRQVAAPAGCGAVLL